MKSGMQMLSSALPPTNRPFGAAKSLIRLGALFGAIVVVSLVLAHDAADDEALAQQAPGSVPRAFYVSYVDDPDDQRGWKNYGRLKDALKALDPRGMARVELDFVQVVVGSGKPIGAVLDELVRASPAAIVATSDDVLQAAKAATQSIPILFMVYSDPVATGEVKSMAAPGVNRTGFTFHVRMLAKAIEILVDAYPASKRIGVLIDSLAERQRGYAGEVQAARRTLGVHIDVFVADDKAALASVLASRKAHSVDAWFVTAGAALWYDEDAVIGMMTKTAKPLLYDRIDFVREGAPMAYEARFLDPFRIWANQLLMIAEGVDVSTIPVERPSRFDFALNLAVIASNPALRPDKSIVRRANVLVAGRQP
jgi:putative ABC transport system substrate-binding protein